MPRAQGQDDKPYYVAGIFLADDDVIVRIAEASKFKQDGLAYDEMLPRRTEKASGHLGKDLAQGFKLISKAMPEPCQVKSVGIAMPGPIRGSGTVSTEDADILTTMFHRRGKKWEKVDLKAAVKASIEAAGASERVSPDFRFRILPDAAAYALGEYMYAKHDLIGKVSDTKAGRDHFRDTTVFAHLTIDEGIAGSIVSKGDFVHSRLHAEIGHLPLRRYPGIEPLPPEATSCKAHKFFGCAEAYVSLPALRKRWQSVERDLPKWKGTDEKVRLVAYYIMQICMSLVLVAAPSRIYLSGRVVRNPELVDLVNLYLEQFLTIPHSHAVYPGYDEQLAPGFVRRRTQNDVGVYGCLIEAERSSGEILRFRK